MIFTWIFSTMFAIIGWVFDLVLNPVTTLPFGIDTALTYAVTTMNAVSYYIPFLVVPWALARFALLLEAGLFGFEIFLWIVTLGNHKPKTF